MLMSKEDRKLWTGMRLVRDLRREQNISAPQQVDSKYRSIQERPDERKFNTLKMPKALKKELPFASIPKLDKARSSNKSTYLQRRAVILEPNEKKIYKMLQQINTIKNEKERKRKEKTAEKHQEYQKKLALKESLKAAKTKEVKKAAFRKLGQAEKRKGDAEVNAAAFGSKRFKRE